MPSSLSLRASVAVVGLHLRVGRHVVEGAVGRKPDADLVLADRVAHRLGHLEPKAGAVLDRTAIFVGALVGIGPDELLDQITIGAVKLDAVEAGGDGVLRRVDILLDRGLDVGRRHRVRGGVRLQPFGVGVHLTGRSDRRRPHDLGAGGQIVRMADASGVHELNEDLGAAGVHCCGHLLPALDLGRREDAGNARIAEPVRRRRRSFGDDQAGAGALRVILHHQRVRHIVGRATARQRRHHQVILQRQWAQRCFRVQERHILFSREVRRPGMRRREVERISW